MLIILYFCCI